MTTRTPFQYVSTMNMAFGNPKGNPHAVDWPDVRNQCKNIAAEYKELMDALYPQIISGDPMDVPKLEDVRDALCDIMVFALGAYHKIGLDADADMDAVVDGVMTRFCTDAAMLQDTVAYWAARGITDVYTQGAFPMLCVKCGSDQTDISGDHCPEGKFLKSTGYRKAQFPPLPAVELPAGPPGSARRFFGQQAASATGAQ